MCASNTTASGWVKSFPNGWQHALCAGSHVAQFPTRNFRITPNSNCTTFVQSIILVGGMCSTAVIISLTDHCLHCNRSASGELPSNWWRHHSWSDEWLSEELWRFALNWWEISTLTCSTRSLFGQQLQLPPGKLVLISGGFTTLAYISVFYFRFPNSAHFVCDWLPLKFPEFFYISFIDCHMPSNYVISADLHEIDSNTFWEPFHSNSNLSERLSSNCRWHQSNAE